MKNFILLSLCIFPFALLAQEKKELDSKITEVTVYQSGARVNRVAETPMEKGNQVFLIKGISSKMDESSMQVKVEEGISIISVSQELNYFDPSKLEEEKIEIIEQISFLKDSLDLIAVRSQVYTEEKDLILKNKNIAGQDQLKAEDLESMAIFYRKRLLEIEEQLFNYKLQRKALQKKVDILNKQIREQNAIPQSASAVVRIALSSEQKIAKTAIRLMYNISGAAWTPEYDARIETTEEPLSLAYNAKVYQNTGEDWSDVRLSLSTGDPSRSNDMPDIQPYRLYGDMSYSRSLKSQTKGKSRSNHIGSGRENKTAEGYLIRGTVYDNDGLTAIGASVHLEGTSKGTITDIDGQFSLLVPLDFYGNMVVSYIGFESLSVSPRGYSYHEVYLDGGVVALSEVVVVGNAKKKLLNIRGSRSNSVDYTVDGIRVSESRSTVERQLSNTVFEVEDKYNIPSDNKPYDVQLLSYDISATYSYYAVPKLSADAYLLANITNWEDYELLDGKLSIYFKGVFQGYSSIEVQELGDTLSFSVGKDPDIILERKLDKTFNSKSFLGANVKEQKAWNIAIRNTKSSAIRLVVEDQVPVSSRDNIKVDIIEKSAALLEENSGKLRWDLDLPPDSNRRLSLKYEVRYPKKMTVIIQ